MQIFQQNFEHSLDQLIGAIRKQFNVSEKAMDSSFKLHQVPVASLILVPYVTLRFHFLKRKFTASVGDAVRQLSLAEAARA